MSILKKDDKAKLDDLHHSAAHLLAAAVLELWPGTKNSIGPSINNGFYYDFEFTKPISENDLPKIEKKMKQLIKNWQEFKREEITVSQAKKHFADNPYKLELIEEFSQKDQTLSLYHSGKFTDLCRGGHINNPAKDLKHFKLLSLAGAYWRGNEKNTMLTRIYGTAWFTESELNDYLKTLAEAEKRDHRKLGKDLELFMMNDTIGSGLPIWLPKGAIVRKMIENYLYDELSQVGYQWLYTPHIASRRLWNISGHLDFYNDSMYSPMEMGRSLKEVQKGIKTTIKDEYLIRPMNCPFHIQVYNLKIRSYRELPIKYAELGTVYRYERSGTLHGLTRVRGFTQDDAHLVCTPEQMPGELKNQIEHAIKMLDDFGFKKFNIYLSTKPERYVGDEKNWEVVTTELEKILKNLKLKYEVDEGGGVFYGPKIDIKIKDALDREWQCTTVQFDFNLPEKFDMTYTDTKGQKVRPYMIHRALLGSLERFFGVLIEHYAGAFPVWLSPTQISIISVGKDHREYCDKVGQELKQAGLRVEIDNANETVGNKIRKANNMKIPYILVIGDKEMKSDKLTMRVRGDKKLLEITQQKFIEKVKQEITEKK